MIHRSKTTRLIAAILAAGLIGGAAPPAGSQEAVSIADGTVASFDGTPIAYTLFVPDTGGDVPVVFNTHGWGGTRSREVGGTVANLLGWGYAVLTWDARGFGDSGGAANVDSQELEVRDVQALIDFVAAQDGIALDAPGDPRMGMVGGSYAGGIQLMTASADTRVDAIVPQIAWNDLPQSLKPNGIFRLQWDLLLYGAGLATATSDGLDAPDGPQTGAYAPQIHQSFVEGQALNDWTSATTAWFDAKSPKHYINGATLPDGRQIPGISAPALIIQGASDTLFPINEAVANFEQIRANGVDAKMMFFCGGHTIVVTGSSCTPGENQRDFINGRIEAWFAKYLDGESVHTGDVIDFQNQDGDWANVPRLPELVRAGSGSGFVVGAVAPTSGTVIGGTPSHDGFSVPLETHPGTNILGIPRATVEVTGLGHEAYLFFKLVDTDADGNSVVVDDQVMALKVGFPSDAPQTFEIDLAGVSWEVEHGHTLSLDVSSTSADHASSRTPFIATLDVSVDLPVQ